MTTVLIKHPVQDYTIWKAAFDNFSDTRKAAGEKSYHIYRTIRDQNKIVVVFEWDNVDKALAFLQSQELRTAMQQAGVTGQPDITVMESAAQGDT